MGRVSRYKKIKAVDPFAKPSRRAASASASPGARVGGHDLPPKPGDADRIPRKLAELMRATEKATAEGGKKKKEAHSDSNFNHIKALPGESMKQFAKRVNAERSKQLAQIRSGEVVPAAATSSGSAAPKAAAAPKPPKVSAKTVTTADGDMQVETVKAAEPETSIDVMEQPDVIDISELIGAGAEGKAGKKKKGDDGPVDITAFISAGMKRRIAADSESFFAPVSTGKPVSESRKKARTAEAAPAGPIKVADDEFPVDVVAFGERAEAPPQLKVLPRMSKRQKDAMQLAAAAAAAQSRADAAVAHAERVAAGKVKDARGRTSGKPSSKAAEAAEREAAAAEREAAAAKAAERAAAVAAEKHEELRTQTLAAYHALKRQKRAAEQAARTGLKAGAAGGAASGPKGALRAGPVPIAM